MWLEEIHANGCWSPRRRTKGTGCGEIINWAHKGSASEALPTLRIKPQLYRKRHKITNHCGTFRRQLTHWQINQWFNGHWFHRPILMEYIHGYSFQQAGQIWYSGITLVWTLLQSSPICTRLHLKFAWGGEGLTERKQPFHFQLEGTEETSRGWKSLF